MKKIIICFATVLAANILVAADITNAPATEAPVNRQAEAQGELKAGRIKWANEDIAGAVAHLSRASNLGNADASGLMGYCQLFQLQEGDALPEAESKKQTAKALALIHKSVAAGSLFGEFALGYAHANHYDQEPLPEDADEKEKAMNKLEGKGWSLVEKAADAGIYEAQIYFAVSLSKKHAGDLVHQYLEKAATVKQFSPVANGKAAAMLGALSLRGLAAPTTLAEGKKWYGKAVEFFGDDADGAKTKNEVMAALRGIARNEKLQAKADAGDAEAKTQVAEARGKAYGMEYPDFDCGD